MMVKKYKYESKCDDAFCWRWMNLQFGNIKKYSDSKHYYWAVHVSDALWEGFFPNNAIHEWRLPWSKFCNDDNTKYIDEFRSIHFARANANRQKNIERFYQVSSLGDKRYNYVNLYHQYHAEDNLEYFDVPKDAYKTYEDAGIDILTLIDFNDDGQHYTDAVLDDFNRNGIMKYAWLDIWDEAWCKKTM